MKIHTVIVGDGETLEQALKRVMGEGKAAERDPAEVVKELSIDALDAVLSVPAITEHLYRRAEAKLGRKPKRKIENIPLFGGALAYPVDTIDLEDREWFDAMTEALAPILRAVSAIKLGEL